MAIQGRECGTLYVVRVGVEFTVKSIVDIKRVVERARSLGHNCFLFDMSQCCYMDSSGVGLLGNVYKRCHKKGGKIGFLKPQKQIKDLITITELDGLIESYNSEEEFGAALR